MFAERALADWLTRVLGIVTRALSSALIRRAGLRRGDGAQTGMITFIQRAGSALNLNVHLPILVPDGAAVRYRIAVGPQAARKTMTLRSPGPMADDGAAQASRSPPPETASRSTALLPAKHKIAKGSSASFATGRARPCPWST